MENTNTDKDHICSPSWDEHTISLQEFLERYDTNEQGLTNEEAKKRLGQCGYNIIEETGKETNLHRFSKQFKNFFSILLIIGSLLSFFAEWVNPGQGNLYIGIALAGVVILNGIFTFVQEYQAEKIMDSFRQLVPPKTQVIRDNKLKEIPASELVIGDIIHLEEGDKVPADGRLIEINSLKVDNSPITGESEPQLRSTSCTHSKMLECRNMVFSGTLVQTGNGKAVVFGTGKNTQIGNLASLTEKTLSLDTPIRKELNHFIKIISSIAMILGFSFFLAGFMIQNIFLANLIFAIGIIVANVPEGLLPTVTLSLSLASKRMAKRKALIKQLESVETLGSTSVICADKTGTITQNKMAVKSLLVGFEEVDKDESDNIPDIFIRVAGLCNNSKLNDKEPGYIGDPTEGALLVYANNLMDLKSTSEKYPRLEEYPFDSNKKRMQIIASTPEEGMVSYLKGAPEIVLEICNSVIKPDGSLVSLTDENKDKLYEKHLEMAERGERVIALAYRGAEDKIEYEDDFVFLGFVGIIDPPRTEAKGAIEKCHKAGIKVVMITGDHPVTAKSIAKSVGLASDDEELEMITGDELEVLSPKELSSRLKKKSIVFARTSPVQKLKIVQAFKESGEIVTMTGDGVNDAPAIKNADMGVAMGSGTDVAREASDMILMDNNFATIVNAVEEGRKVFDNIKKFISYILTSNIPEILPFIAFILLAIPLPITVQLILAIDLGTDILPALALGVEKSEEDIMNRPPRSLREKLLTPQMLFHSYGIKGPVEALAGFFCYFTVLYDGGWVWGEQLAYNNPLYMQSITAFFAAIIICQISNEFISRTRKQSIFTKGAFSNKLILGGIASELVILALIIWNPFANLIFNTAPIDFKYLTLAIPFALLILVIDEFRKYLVRKDVKIVKRVLEW